MNRFDFATALALGTLAFGALPSHALAGNVTPR